MRTVGVDLSAESKKTWVAVVDWADGRASLVSLHGGQSDEQIAAAAAEADVVGVDCPLGWPDDFVDFVVAHHRADAFVGSKRLEERRRIAFRETDRAVLGRFDNRVRPLSVAADKLGLVAVRCAGLLGTLAAAGLDIDRSGAAGGVVEVYPAASLRAWGYEAQKYKGSGNRDDLARLVGRLASETASWLDLGEHRAQLEHTDDAFDALIAALTAKAARSEGLADPAPEDTSGPPNRYQREGWIWIPTADSLASLAS